MKNLWNEKDAASCGGDPLKLRVYSSRLLGKDDNLVLHGGGNTSVKAGYKDLFGNTEEVLYVKGSGWDLATIEAEGFPGVELRTLERLAEFDQLSDAEMMQAQRAAMVDPSAPSPSVEAILHGIIPFKYVDHTHADAVVTISNTANGADRIAEIFGNKMLIIPYVMPGFVLAKKVYDTTRDTNWEQLDGMILLNHGIFTFDNDAQRSYEKMIESVTIAEKYLLKNTCLSIAPQKKVMPDWNTLAQIRKAVSLTRGKAQIAKIDFTADSAKFSALEAIENIATRGPLTPDHVIRTKRVPIIINREIEESLGLYKEEYQQYFNRNTPGKLTCLDPAPRWAVWPCNGVISFGSTVKEAEVVDNIVRHTKNAILLAEDLDEWVPLQEDDIFDVEYWELEQAKLNKGGVPPVLQGKIALVTGAASGIGFACVRELHALGACVTALDLQPAISSQFLEAGILGLVGDVTHSESIKGCVEKTIEQFGGLDIVISNAGSFPDSQNIEDLDDDTWQQSLELNLTSHRLVLKHSIPFLEMGLDPSVVIIGSKNVPAPGKGAAAYSVAKAGLTQLGRIGALELGPKGIRVNTIHPNAVFDTALWTTEVLKERAERYGKTVKQYKESNLLKTEITSKDVARLACQMAGPVFSKTTGVQIPIDGGNERVI